VAKVKWDKKKLKEYEDVAKKRLIAVGIALEGEIKRSMRGYGAYSNVVTRTAARRVLRQKGKKKKYHYPSPPGMPPAIDTGRLRASITTNWTGSGFSSAEIKSPVKNSSPQDSIKAPLAGTDKFVVVVGTNLKYACIFNPFTSICTNRGSVRISDVKVGDKVLTQTGDYHKVTGVFSRPVVDVPNLVTISVEWRKGRRHTLIVTEDHKILVSRDGRNKWVKAKNLLTTDLVYTRKKVSVNKGTGNIVVGKCLFCSKEISDFLYVTKNRPGGVRQFCNNTCRGKYLKGKKRNYNHSNDTKKKMSEAAISRININPNLHPCKSKLYKRGSSFPEKQVEKWLCERGKLGKYFRQYKIGRYYVDFYLPDENLIIESDGGYWHRSQTSDIERDSKILKYSSDLKILHIHFYDKKWSPKLISNPIPRSYYISCNPGTDSFTNPEIFKTAKILGIRKWTYSLVDSWGRKVMKRKVYDLSIDGVHSYYANGVLVSNSHLEFGTKNIQARPFMRPAYEKLRSRIDKIVSQSAVGSAYGGVK